MVFPHCVMPHSVPAPRNRILASLPPDDLALLWPRLEKVELRSRQVLQAPDQPINHVYFPESGYVSRLVLMESGHSLEAGSVGSDGMVGMPALLGEDHDEFEMLVQVPGIALRLSVPAFWEELRCIPALRSTLTRYSLQHFAEVARIGACGSYHPVEQRLARWLLVAHDQIDADSFPMTHERLGMMLGVRRAGISVAALTLQKAGLIRYRHGRVTITNRHDLEAAACECYGAARAGQDCVRSSSRITCCRTVLPSPAEAWSNGLTNQQGPSATARYV